MMAPDVESRISDTLAALHAHWYGKGLSAARTYIAGDDVVVVVLEETFTPAEQALVDRGEAAALQEVRRRFRRVMGDELVATVEQATGRRVRSYASDTDLAERVSVEVFLLGATLEDMSGFETAVESEASCGSSRVHLRRSRERDHRVPRRLNVPDARPTAAAWSRGQREGRRSQRSFRCR
jgi:uncharacterized protein YbcI